MIYQTSKLTSQWKRSGTGVKTGSSYSKLSRITVTVFGSNTLDSTPNTKGERERGGRGGPAAIDVSKVFYSSVVKFSKPFNIVVF